MNIVVVGEGGHSKVIKDIILSNSHYNIIGYLDDKYKEEINLEQVFYGPLSMVSKLLEYYSEIKFIIAIGSNSVRKQIVEKLNLPDNYFLSIQHRSAIVSPLSQVGVGTVIMPNAVINADSMIGSHVIINTGAVVEHDNKIDNYAHISPNATLTGSVVIEEGVQVGAGATLIPSVHIGEWSIIGAGATVIHNIPSYSTAVGTPAKVKNKIKIEGVSYGQSISAE
ncbi:acetyltransferase [Bacillus sp. JJ634]